MLFSATLSMFLMCAESRGDSILTAFQHFQPSEPNVVLPVPYLTGTAQLLIIHTQDHLLIAGIVDRGDLEQKSPLVVKELKVYPDELLEKSQVRQIIFCKGLQSGTPFKMHTWGGLADYEHNVIFLDASLPASFLPTAFHHELFHYLDWQMGFASNDPEWLSFNEPGEQYRGYQIEQLYAQRDNIHFITTYSQASMLEDKAEVFAYLISDPKLILDRAKRSPVLERKVDCIKRRLQEFCPKINKEFWSTIEAKHSSSSGSVAGRSNSSQFEWEDIILESLPIPDDRFAHYTPALYEPNPPLNDVAKVSIFVGVMVSPWFLLMFSSWIMARIRREPSSPRAAPSQQ